MRSPLASPLDRTRAGLSPLPRSGANHAVASEASEEPLPPEVAVGRLLHGMEALLRWIKAEVSAAQPSMDWAKFYAEGLVGTEEGKVHCVDSETNTRIYTEEEVASQLLVARHKQIEKEHKTASG